MRYFAALVLAISSFFGVVATTPAEAAPVSVEKQEAVLAIPTAYQICAWVGVRDGLLGNGLPTTLRHAENFTFYGDTRWVKCQVEWDRGDYSVCFTYIVWRVGKIPGYPTDTIHLSGSSCAWS